MQSAPGPRNLKKEYHLPDKTLFKIMFEDFLKTDAKFIDLDAVTNGPFNAVSKYMSLGFKQRGGENCIIAMRTGRDNVRETSSALEKFIRIRMLQNTEDIPLSEV